MLSCEEAFSAFADGLKFVSSFLRFSAEKKEKIKTEKSAVNLETGSTKEAGKTDVIAKSSSSKNGNSDFAENLKKEETNLSPSAKAENASSQESKTGDGVKISEKDFAQHILMGDKELKAGGSA
ncbi:MAG TPA: hypothetical protein VHO28_11490, partial [Ignavibacteriales bacterium]|nr:hypothetical protein [Ignavibacteriales bacterium]